MKVDSTPVLCDHCNTPVMEVSSDGIRIHARHHGEKHGSFYPWKQMGDRRGIVLPDGRVIELEEAPFP